MQAADAIGLQRLVEQPMRIDHAAHILVCKCEVSIGCCPFDREL
jgi:hypothetical protein